MADLVDPPKLEKSGEEGLGFPRGAGQPGQVGVTELVSNCYSVLNRGHVMLMVETQARRPANVLGSIPTLGFRLHLLANADPYEAVVLVQVTGLRLLPWEDSVPGSCFG